MSFDNKLVAILNKELSSGVVLNALGHMAIGLGASLSKDKLLLNNYKDYEGNIYPNISQMPFIILRAKSNEIRKTVNEARKTNIALSIFINTMTGGTYQEQIQNTAITNEDKLIYYGCILFGSFEDVNNLTKKFSLWKDKEL